MERNEKLRKARAKQSRGRREDLTKKLENFFRDVHAGVPEIEVGELLKYTLERYKSLASWAEHDRAAGEIIAVETEAFARMSQTVEQFRISKPRGLGFTRQVQRDWDAYESERARLESDVFRPARVRLNELVAEFAGKLKIEIDRRRSLDLALKEVGARERKKTNTVQREAKSELTEAERRAVQLTRTSLAAIENTIVKTISDFERTNVDGLDAAELEALRSDLEGRITAVAEKELSNIEKLRDQIRLIATETGLEQGELTGALEEEVEALRAKEFEGLQLAQIGMALSIVQHEFAGTVNSVRNNLKRLKPWADANVRLGPIYKDIRNSFDHLDGYLTLFTPLNRRMNRRRAEITGEEIKRFLVDLFGERLARHKVKLVSTSAFTRNKIVGFHSSILPVFVNLLDNSMFWLSRRPEDRRVITLDAEGDAFVISDSGPGIPARDQRAVFELGFTRKPGGRGMGLYISREVLARAGYELTLDQFAADKGATFRIAKPTSSGDFSEEQTGSASEGETN